MGKYLTVSAGLLGALAVAAIAGPGLVSQESAPEAVGPALVSASQSSPHVGAESGVATHQEIIQDQLDLFETSIRPVLAGKCYQCHSATASKVRGGLLLDTREGLLRGGNSGPAIKPGDPDNSLLIKAIRYTDEDTAMPPEKQGGKLPDSVIADFEKWVLMGAPDPRDAASSQTSKTYNPEAAKKWWAFQPVKPPPVPAASGSEWSRGDIDRFVLAGLEQKGLKPVSDADKLTLLRRVCFDLIGLPPPPETAKWFLENKSPDAYAQLVDALLATSQFGERWGRHWLDVARYAESSGKDLNVAFPHAWRYRDYVISSFNKDKPYDQFIREQIAGDLLSGKDVNQKAEQLIATGFLAIGTKNLGELTPRQFELDLADEQIDATSQAFLGLTVSCARCHDHKFDPISQRDYYALAGIFLSTDVRYGTLSGPKNNQERGLIELPKEAALPVVKANITAEERAVLTGEHAAAKARYDRLMAQRRSPRGTEGRRTRSTAGDGEAGVPRQGRETKGMRPRRQMSADGPMAGSGEGGGGEMRSGSGPQFFIQVQVALGKMAELANELNSYDENGKAKAFAMGVQDRPAGDSQPLPMRETKVVEIKGSSGIRPPSGFETIADSPLFERGEMNQPGERVPRGFPPALTHFPAPTISSTTSGRKELADWMASPENPLTARVMANRIWYWLFGKGLVETVDNFGLMGSPPSNQALLDHVATRLVQNWWSIKSTIREIVLSRTYQLASTHDAANFSVDPQNTYIWRRNKRRLDAECIRDSMLYASGQLDYKPLVGSVVALAGEGPIGSTGSFVRINEDTLINAVGNYRSVYLPIARDLLPDALSVFDYSDASLVMGAREQTNVPAQALYMLNNGFVSQQTEKFAQRLIQSSASDQDRVRLAYSIAYGREPSPKEFQTAKRFLDQEKSLGSSEVKAWSTFCLGLFGSAEFTYLD